MTVSYSWIITELKCYPQQEGDINVVFSANWRRIANDGAGHIGQVYGSQIITVDGGAPFTPYDQLTEAQVIGWLEDAFGAEALAAQVASLDKQIEDQINPPVLRMPNPWQTVVAPPAPDLIEPTN